MENVTINGIEYEPVTKEKMPWQIVRTFSAGVFAGFVESRNGQEVVMRDAIRIWSWSGAASLSQMAVDGVKNPNECKFAVTVQRVLLTQAIEILDVTEKAREILIGVKRWKA